VFEPGGADAFAGRVSAALVPGCRVFRLAVPDRCAPRVVFGARALVWVLESFAAVHVPVGYVLAVGVCAAVWVLVAFLARRLLAPRCGRLVAAAGVPPRPLCHQA
jgi:hypothetical protein